MHTLNTMTLGTLLNKIMEACPDLEEADLMKIPVQVRVPHTSGTYVCTTGVRDIKVRTVWDNDKKRYKGEITFETGMIRD